MSKEQELKQHQLFISSFRLWKTLKKQNEIDDEKKPMFRKILMFTLLTAPFRWLQRIFYHKKIKNIKLKDPVFVLGHWRSGTTHLHYLLSLDEQFTFLENFQAFFFKVAFVSKTLMKPILGKFMPKTRPQDNIKIDADSPCEEEHPLTNLTEKCGMQSFFFPKNRTYFDKYNVLKGITDEEKKSWKETYHFLLQAIALYRGKDKTLLLKNPHNTARIELLLELYPNAKFIHIHRNPYDVYKSNLHLYDATIKSQFLNVISDDEIADRVVYCYKETMKKFIADYKLIPKQNFVEISFADLTQNTIPTLEHIYDSLSISLSNQTKRRWQEYLQQEKDYKKNKFTTLPLQVIQDLSAEWGFALDHFGYPIREK